MAIYRQLMATFILCSMGITFGLMFAWPSSTIKLFSSTNTTLNRPMTETELALFGSLPSVTALISTPLSGFLLDVLGRKYTCLLFALPQVLSWTLVVTWSRVESILLAMCISGLGGCIFTVLPVYICEISQESIRGTTSACSIIFYGLGVLFSYLLGGYLDYEIMNYVCLTVSVIGVGLLMVLKESPTFLLKKGLEKEAAQAIAYYRVTKVDSKEVLRELNMIHKVLNPTMDDFSPEEEKLSNVEKVVPEKLSFLQFLKKSKSTRKGLMLTIFMYTFSILQGLVVVQVYAEPLFEEALPNISANLMSILFALLNTVIGFIAAYLTDTCGRRALMIYSSFATGVCCIVLGTQIQLHWTPLWLNGVFLYAFCITYTFGAGTVPFVLVADLFLPEVRSILTMIATEWAWTCNFVLLFIFNPLAGAIGLGPVFYIFAVVCFMSVVYCIFYMPETKGLTVDVIQTLLLR